MEKLTPAERGIVTQAKNLLAKVDYQSTSATYIHNLILIIERLTKPQST